MPKTKIDGINLKPCPFCGGEGEIRKLRFGVEKFSRYGAICPTCAICLGWEMNEDEAAAKWNRRDGCGEPRLMSLNEALGVECCWLEQDADARIRPACCVMLANGSAYVERLKADPVLLQPEDYGKTWRCWTAKPSDSQRAGAKWND